MQTSDKHIPQYSSRRNGNTKVYVDYEKAIQNLTDIMINQERFSYMCRVIYDACDIDNSGSIDVSIIEEFVRTSMRGH